MAGATLGVGATSFAGLGGAALMGGTSGAASGYMTGGWKGAGVGLVVGAITSEYAPAAAYSVSKLAGGGLSGMFLGTGTYVGINGISVAVGALAGNAVAGQPLGTNVGYGFGIGALAPLASGEAYLIGTGGEAVFGEKITNIFGIYSNILSTAGGEYDPSSNNTLAPHVGNDGDKNTR